MKKKLLIIIGIMLFALGIYGSYQIKNINFEKNNNFVQRNSISNTSFFNEKTLSELSSIDSDNLDFKNQTSSDDFEYINVEDYNNAKKESIQKIDTSLQHEDCSLVNDENCYEIHSLFGDGQDYQKYKNPTKNININIAELLGTNKDYIIYTNFGPGWLDTVIFNLNNLKNNFTITEGDFGGKYERKDWFWTNNAIYIHYENIQNNSDEKYIRYDFTGKKNKN